MPLPQHQKDFLLKQQHASRLYNLRHLQPSMEQWVIGSSGGPVGRPIFWAAADLRSPHREE